MTADARTLRESLNRRPFEPFTIRMNDGREFEVWHPNLVFFPGGWHATLLLAKLNDEFDRLGIAEMKEIDPSVSPGKVLLSEGDTPVITDRGRGPEITGTRITVYDVLDYYKHGDPPDAIARWLPVSENQIRSAIRYIEEHRQEVLAAYQEMLDRCARGNPPEVQAKLEQSHKRFMAWVEEHQRTKIAAASGARASG